MLYLYFHRSDTSGDRNQYTVCGCNPSMGEVILPTLLIKSLLNGSFVKKKRISNTAKA